MDTKSAFAASRRRHTARVARRSTRRRSTRDARRADHSARDSPAYFLSFVRFRARRSRARGTVARRPSVGRTDRIPRRWRRLGSIGEPVDVARPTAAWTRTRRARGTNARFEKTRARSRGVRSTDASVDERVRAEEADGSAAVDFV